VNNHEDKDASFFIKLDRVESTRNPFRNRNKIAFSSTVTVPSSEPNVPVHFSSRPSCNVPSLMIVPPV
jgi:hypothetical protein